MKKLNYRDICSLVVKESEEYTIPVDKCLKHRLTVNNRNTEQHKTCKLLLNIEREIYLSKKVNANAVVNLDLLFHVLSTAVTQSS